MDPETHNIFVDTRQHYVLVLHREQSKPDEIGPVISAAPALVAMSSTQLKRSRQFMALVMEAQRSRKLVSIMLDTVAESNDEGTWRGWHIVQGNDCTNDEVVVSAAVDFANALREGNVEVDESQFADKPANASSAQPAGPVEDTPF